MLQRIGSAKLTADESIIAVLDNLYADYERAELASKSCKTSDVKNFLDVKAKLDKTLKMLESYTADDIFETRKDVYNYLVDNGYKVAVRTIYDHVENGKLKFNQDNQFNKADVDLYAKKHLTQALKEDLTEELKRSQLDIMRSKSVKESLQVEQLTGELIKRDKVAVEFAGRIEEMKRAFEEVEQALPILLTGKCEAEIRVILKERHNYILSRYSRKLESIKR